LGDLHKFTQKIIIVPTAGEEDDGRAVGIYRFRAKSMEGKGGEDAFIALAITGRHGDKSMRSTVRFLSIR